MSEENVVINNDAQQNAEPNPEPHETFPDSGYVPLSESSAIDNLPLVPTDPKNHTQDRTAIEAPYKAPSQPSPTYELPKADIAPALASTPSQDKSTQSPSPLYETQKDPVAAPEKSSDAEAIRNEPVPAGIKGKAAESFNVAKTKWAGIVEAKDAQLRNAVKAEQDRIASILKENESLASRVAALSGYETAIDYQSSEKFQKEFEAPVKDAESSLMDFAKQWATPEGLAELQKGIGDRRYLIAAITELEKSNPLVATEFRMGVQKILDTQARRNAAINDAKQNHTKFVEERRSESAKKSAQFDEGVKNSITQYTTMVGEDKQTPQFPFLVKQRAPAGSPPELTAQVDAHNKFVDENVASLSQVVKAMDSNPSERVRMAVGYMTAVVQANHIRNLTKQLEEARSLVSRVQRAGSPPDKASGASLPPAPRETNVPLSEFFEASFPRR